MRLRDAYREFSSLHRRIAFDAPNQAERALAKVGGVMRDLRFAEPFQSRDAAIEGLDQPVEIREHVPGVRAPAVGYRGHRVLLPGIELRSRSGCHT